MKLSKKALAVLDKAEIRHIAVVAMGLTNQDGAYRFNLNELIDWVLERQDAFVEADLSVCQETHLRPGVLQYLQDMQKNIKGEGPKVDWPPTDVEVPQTTEEPQMSHDDHTFPELDDEDEGATEVEEDPPVQTAETSVVEPVKEEPPEEAPKKEETKPLRRPMPLPAALGKPSFMRINKEAPKPAAPTPPQAVELPGTITENLSNVNNRINEMSDKLEQVANTLDSKVQQLRSDINSHSTKARTDAIERAVKKLDADMQVLSTAVLHLINVMRPWAEAGIQTFPNLESLPDASVYGDEIVREEVENG